MAKLENPKHEVFAQAVALGDTKTGAYERAYPKAMRSTGLRQGSRLLKRPEVRERVREIQARAATRAALTLVRKREILAEIAEGRIPMRTVRRGTDAVQEIYEPMKAIELDARLAGELNPQAETNGMEGILERLFGEAEGEGGLP